jgi:hypothetical protein
MALIEQGMVVFSSIHGRLHNSMARVLKILHRIDSAYLTEEDIDAQSAGLEVNPADFDGPMDIVPVSDPNIFSETQRFVQVQAIMQRAAMMPAMYDQRKVEEMFLRTMKIEDKDVLQPAPGTENRDPVSENVAASMGQPVYVLPKQDHIAHLKVHMAFLRSPLFGMNPMIQKTYMFPIAQHLRDHLLNYYMTEAHRAVSAASEQNLIADDGNEQAAVILQVQQFIEQQFGPQFAQELAQLDQAADQFRPQPPMPPDNSMQIAQINAQVQGQALQQRAQSDQARLAQQAQIEQQKLADRQQDRQEKMQAEQLRQMSENQRTAAELEARERMNFADNETAMRLAAAEIASGDKVAVSTGTGINPNPNQ